MKVGLYARVSTREQTPENQLQDLRRLCSAKGWEIAGEYVDAGISGAKEDRPALRDLMLAARRRTVDAVLVWRFDRFARSLKHLINTLGELNELGVQFVSYSEGLDTSTSQGRLVFGVIGAIAEFERDLIRERVNAGLRRAREEGKRLGRPTADAAAAVKARQLRAQGLSLRDISGQTSLSIATLSRLFHKPLENFGNLSVGEPIQK